MNKKIKSILNQFRERVFSEFSNQIISIVVFGSYARGEERPDSDLDILVVVREKSKSLEKKSAIFLMKLCGS